jgi:inner membrane protein involved in colicin E2 resistance
MNTEQIDLLEAESSIDDYATNNLLITTKWTKFLGISSAIFFGIMIIAFAISGTYLFDTFNTALKWGIQKENVGNFTLLFYVSLVIVSLIAGFFCYLAIAFSIQIKQGIITTNQDAFEKGFVLLKNYFIAIGVFTIIGLLINIASSIFLKI